MPQGASPHGPDTPESAEPREPGGERLGALLRRLRETAGLSQQELADEATRRAPQGGVLERGEISRWERERRLIGPYWIHPVAAALGVPAARLQQARAVSRAARAARAQPRPTSGDEVLSSLLPAGESLAPTVTERGRRVGMREAQLILRRCHAFRLADDVLAGGDLVAPVLRELRAARELFTRSAHTEAVGRVLLTGIAEFAQLAGWVAADAGLPGADPARLYRLGAAAAREAGDRPLLGHLLGSLAYYETNRGNTGLGARIAHTLRRESGPQAPPRARTLCAERLAWCAVRAGDTQGALRALEQSAEDLAAHEPGEDEQQRWLYWVGPAESEVMRARVFTEARRPLRAVPLLRRALRDYPATHTRELALYQSWLAAALLDANEFEEAAEVARSTLELSASVPSSRAAQRGALLVGRLRAHRQVPAVADVLADWG